MAPTTLTPVPPPTNATRFSIRALESADFRHLQRLEKEIWSDDPTGQLCPFYLRLCTEHYSEWCFICFEGERPVGYVLNFPRGKVNYCATLAVHPDFQKSKVNYLLIRAMVVKLLQEDMEECKFLVEPDNWDARSIHESLGARVIEEVQDFYHKGDTRLWSSITKDDLERIRAQVHPTEARFVSDSSTCSVASLPQELTTPYAAFHMVPLLRLASVLGMTLGTVGSLMLIRYPQLALHRWARAALRCLGVTIEIQGTLHGTAQLWVSNHLSWLDPLVLLSLRPMGALAKGEVGQYPLIGPASRKVGLAFVDRLDATSRASAVARLTAELRQGKPMLLFPEGTTTRGHGLAPLQEGGLRAAFRCGATVQTLRLSSTDPGYPWIGDDSLLPHLVKIAQAAATPVRLEAGAVLEPRQFSSEAAWIETIRQQLTPTSRGSLES